MLHVGDLRGSLPLFRALGSATRLDILDMLYENGPMRMTDICLKLGLTGGALTPHIRMLCDCGLVSVTASSGRHGVQKICAACQDRILIDPARGLSCRNVYETEIGVGQYTAWEALPTCGLATVTHVVGKPDDPRYFASPERVNAGVMWLGAGFVEYTVPNMLRDGQTLSQIQVSLELCSEAPGFCEDWPSDIDFSINGTRVLTWTSPGDLGAVKGIFTPAWWDRNWNQHGLLKLLSVDGSGAYIDGGRVSGVTIDDLNISGDSFTLRIAAPSSARHAGGLTILGRGFGNYEQDIRVRQRYTTA